MRLSNIDVMVGQAAANAKENGYTFRDAEEMALDMCTYDSDLQDVGVDDVRASIIKQKLI